MVQTMDMKYAMRLTGTCGQGVCFANKVDVNVHNYWANKQAMGHGKPIDGIPCMHLH